jgi:predicted FMN-binding regulatory protein PaiB
MYVDRHPLATLILVDGGKAYADHLPFLRTDRLVIGASLFSHVARPNATWRIAESGPEASRAEPWSVADAPPAYIDRMLEGFVALTLEVGEITAKSKSSQNRLPRDQLGVMEGLGADPATSEAAQVIATRLGRLTA